MRSWRARCRFVHAVLILFICRVCGEYLEDQCHLPHIPGGITTGETDGDYMKPYNNTKLPCEPGDRYKRWTTFIMCEESGEWEKEFEECTGFKLTFICDEGIWHVGKNSWRHYKSGWSGNMLYSKEIQCPDPGVPENGERIGNYFKVSDKVNFKCFPGYDLVGSVERVCQPNGQWSGELTRCNKRSNYCPNPGIPVKGYKNSTSYGKGDKIRFRCQPGYILLGSKVRECLLNGTWSGTETSCSGPYDVDNNGEVKDQFARIADNAELMEKLRKYTDALHHGSLLDVNDPRRLILYFAFDVSGRIGFKNFDKSIQFAKAIVRKVGISEDGALAGALTFNSPYKHEQLFSPLNFSTTEDVLNALDQIQYTGGDTASTSALSVLRHEIIPLTNEKLGRNNLKSIIFLLADGNISMSGSLEIEAEALKISGVDIYCIGITGGVQKESLYKIASTTMDSNGTHPKVYILQNYSSLSWLVQNITKGTVDYSLCGLGVENIDAKKVFPKVVDGRIPEEPWPWVAALYISHRDYLTDDSVFTGELICGGSIIHRNFILTAAHCLYKKGRVQLPSRNVIVKLGLTDVNIETHLQEHKVVKMFVHSNYHDLKMYDYDIALLQLARPIEYNPFVRPICLPPIELQVNSLLYSPGEYGWSVGWGHQNMVPLFGTITKWNTSEVLLEVPILLQSRETCVQNLKKLNIRTYRITDSLFCAGDGKGKMDTCRGDSGNSLMQPQFNSEGYLYWTQIGIVGSGAACAANDTYGLYIHAQNLRTWIDQTIEEAHI